MHIHPMTRVSAAKEAEVVAMKLKHVCYSCSHNFPALRGLISITKRENLDSNGRHNAIHKYRKSITNYMIE